MLTSYAPKRYLSVVIGEVGIIEMVASLRPNKRMESFASLTRTALRVPNFVVTKSVPHKAAAHARR